MLACSGCLKDQESAKTEPEISLWQLPTLSLPGSVKQLMHLPFFTPEGLCLALKYTIRCHARLGSAGETQHSNLFPVHVDYCQVLSVLLASGPLAS